MALSLTPLFKDMVRQFQTITTDERFQQDFVAAVNKVLDQLSFAAVDTTFAHVNGYNAEINDLESRHTYILTRGLVVELMMSGRKHVSGAEGYPIALDAWSNAQGDFRVMNYRTDAEDDEADIIGLGYLGD